jgi:zinc transport system ATP-binding protein
MKPSITIEHLSFAYQEVDVLEDVTLHIFPGEFVGIIGPNGGGKTTLLKLLMGFLKPRSGSISLLGKDPLLARAHIGYVPQAMRFDKQFPITVLEVVLLGRLAHLSWYGTYRRGDKEAAMRALERVGMAEYCDRVFGTLSGGQAQRTLIARAIVSDPTLLLLDEPTANIDSKAQNEIYELLQALRGEKTILMVTHDLNVAIHYVQRVVCVQQQVILLKPNEVCEHFALGLYHPPLMRTVK